MLNPRLGSLVHVAFPPAARVVVLVVLAWADSNVWDLNVVFALDGFDVGRSDVGYAASASAEGSISMVADFALANDLSIAIPAQVLDGLCWPLLWAGEDVRCGINSNVSSSCPQVSWNLPNAPRLGTGGEKRQTNLLGRG